MADKARILPLSRRDLLIGLGASALLARTPLAFGDTPGPAQLTMERRVLEVNGRAAHVYGIAYAGRYDGYRAVAGQGFRVRLTNRLDQPTLVHWHGLTPPTAQDGVPGLSQPALAPGNSYDYDFPLTRSGTFWMHSHVGLQEQQLLAAPLIVADPADAKSDEQVVVIMLHDFSFRAPEEILADLRKPDSGSQTMAMAHGNMPGMGGQAGGAMPMDHGKAGQPGAMDMSHGMSGATMDINDVDYDAYLANDRTLADPEVVTVTAGTRVRLRIINGSASTNFHIELGALKGELIAVDGDPVAPIAGARFGLAIAQRADIRLSIPKAGGAFPVLALREGALERTGIVLATKGAPVRKLASVGAKPSPVLDLTLERRLRAAQPLSPRPADRILRVELTGDMARYQWSIDGQVYGQHPPLPARLGERVELELVNRTMMSHPMHLHGHHFQVVAIDGKRFAGALRDTVLVPPRGAVTAAFDADNPGRWAFHCHNLYHMAVGMMTELRYLA